MKFFIIFSVLISIFAIRNVQGDEDKGNRRRRLQLTTPASNGGRVGGPCAGFSFAQEEQYRCTKNHPDFNPNMAQGLSFFAAEWIEYTCCNMVKEDLSGIIAAVWLWLQVCTSAMNTATPDDYPKDLTYATANNIAAYNGGPLHNMRKYCPSDLDGGELTEWVVATFFPVMEAYNPHFQKAHQSVEGCKPKTNTGAVTVLLAEPQDDGTFGHFSMVVHEDDTLALPEDLDDKDYMSFSNHRDAVGVMITGTKAEHVKFGHDLKVVTKTLTLYNADTVAMKAKWEDLKNSGQMFDLLHWNCARTALEVLNAGYPECTVKLEDQLWTPANAWGYVNAMANVVNPDDKKPPSSPTAEAFEMISAETIRGRQIKQQTLIEQQIPVIVILVAIGSFVFNLILVAVVIWAVIARARAVAEAKLERGLAKILLYVAANTGAWPGKKKRAVPKPSYVVPTNKDEDPLSPGEPPSPRLSDHIIAHMDIGDHDGETDFEEFEAWAKRRAVGLKPGEILCVWNKLDHDHDGKVTKQEWDRFMRKRKKLKWLITNIKSIHKRAVRMNAINEEEDEEEEDEHIDEEEDEPVTSADKVPNVIADDEGKHADDANERSGLLQEAPPPGSPLQIKKELSNVSTDTKSPES